MVRVGIAELKAQLSHYLSITKSGEEVLITDRGQPVAKLTPLTRQEEDLSPHLLAMERLGEAKIGTGKLPDGVRERPRLKEGYSAVQVLIDERREAR